MSSPRPNRIDRGYLLPPGCKDLIDVLKPHAASKSQSLGGILKLDALSTEHLLVNGKIQAREVRVCDEAGRNFGVFSLANALALAASSKVDLVLVNAKVSPPLCVLIDYGKYRYQQSKKKKAKDGT